MKKMLIAAAFFAAVISQFNCYHMNQITDENELKNKDKPVKIFVFTKDSTLYCLNNYVLIGDSMLSGSGSKTINEAEVSYKGNIRLNNIKYILSQESNFMQNVLAAGIIGYIGIAGISNLSGKNFRVWPDIQYPGSNVGSCPFIYSWNGYKYILEGEAFGIGLSKSFEMKTSHVLKFLDSDNSIAKIKLSNERLETHYFNKIEVKAIEVNRKARVYSDVNNRFWQVNKLIKPFSANDNSGSNITKKISYKDKNYWESDLKNISSKSDFEDVIKMEFIKNKSVKNGALVINAINTKLSQKVFEFMGGYLGDQVLQFYNSLETDPEMISIFRNWIKEVSLKAFVRNKNKWEELGFIYPEANSISFSKIIPIHFKNSDQDTLKIMLKSLADVWKIDDVQLGTDSKPASKIIDIPLRSANDNNHNNVIQQLKYSDDKYKMLLPSESIELSFNTVSPSHGKKVVYALNVQGYLYEWMSENLTTSGFQFLNINRTEKINYLKNILKYKSLFLPIIYNEWIKEKE